MTETALKLSGKVVLVTGGSSGIGLAAATSMILTGSAAAGVLAVDGGMTQI
ncbi:hypothetical protein HX870_00490 [Pseudomonas gingeri]|uniref:hypothetical protein n=1 Tax=Pseudomonas gingeri TaxID=117681 RepID=UPI0015A4A62C|nr:hypothetical protein [Pseudomonas gingeri]NWD66097.1 hypothetical protein [Pseudomonas gingeri]